MDPEVIDLIKWLAKGIFFLIVIFIVAKAVFGVDISLYPPRKE